MQAPHCHTEGAVIWAPSGPLILRRTQSFMLACHAVHITTPVPMKKTSPGMRSVEIALIALLLGACESAPEAGLEAASATQASAALAVEKTSYTQAGSIKDVSYPLARRFSSRVVVPLGRTREEVTATLERAARDLAQKTDADAVMVFAYRPGDRPEGIYSVGRAVYAPNGKWENADDGGPMQVSVDLRDLYFAPPDTSGSPGDTVALNDPYGDRVDLSNEYGKWGDDNIVAQVPNGSKAVILERESEPMGNQEFVRYRVRTLGATRREGWVHKGDTRQ